MALDLKNRKERLVELTVAYDDTDINLKYRADLLTPAYLNGPETEVEFCAKVIAEWDVTNDGEKTTPSIDLLNGLDAELSYTLCYAIINHTKASAIQRLNR